MTTAQVKPYVTSIDPLDGLYYVYLTQKGSKRKKVSEGFKYIASAKREQKRLNDIWDGQQNGNS